MPPAMGFFTLGGRVMQLSCLGQELFQLLTRPLAHLATEETKPDLLVEVWDESTNDESCPLPAQDLSFVFQDGEVIHHLPFSTTVLNRESQHLVSSVRSASQLSLYECGRPWHAPLSIWHLDQGLPIIHAGAVAKGHGAVLVGGASGSGKSTVCLSAALEGFTYLGDDMVALEETGQGFRVHSLYGSTFLKPEDVSGYPQLVSDQVLPRYSWEEKTLSFPPTEMQQICPVVAVVLPVVTGSQRRSTLEELRPSESLLGLGPSTHQVGVLNPGRLGFELLAKLVESVPSYRLELGLEPWRALEPLLV